MTSRTKFQFRVEAPLALARSFLVQARLSDAPRPSLAIAVAGSPTVSSSEPPAVASAAPVIMAPQSGPPQAKSSQPDIDTSFAQTDKVQDGGSVPETATADQIASDRARGTNQPHSTTSKAEHKDMHAISTKVIEQTEENYDRPPNADIGRPSPKTHSSLNRSSRL